MDRKPAGFGLRFLADLLDWFILTIPISAVLFLLNGEKDFYEWVKGWTWQFIYTLYLTFVPLLWSGYIIGKRMMKIKIKRMDGKELTFKNMLLREVVGKFLLVFLTVGISSLVSIFMILFRADKRGIHDLLGGTYVINERSKSD